MTDILELPGVVPGEPAAAVGQGEGPAAAATARVIGLDLSLTATGMSDGERTWLVRSSGKQDDDLATRWRRLRKVAREICGHIPADVQLVVIESPAFAKTTGHMHDRSGLWWLVVSALHSADVKVVEVPPASLKTYATGKGNADKGQVIEAAVRRFPDVEISGHDGRADALWLAAIGIDHLTGLRGVPESHSRALAKVRWPS